MVTLAVEFVTEGVYAPGKSHFQLVIVPVVIGVKSTAKLASPLVLFAVKSAVNAIVVTGTVN